MENWIFLSLLSAICLGIYDIAKKKSVSGNAVPAVLFLSVSVAAMIWAGPVLFVSFYPSVTSETLQQLTQISTTEHLLLLLKSMLVGSSWTFAFFALKHLPISIATPIRATSPLWTILVAVIFLSERPAAGQWFGMLIVVVAFLSFSFVGSKEGIHFAKNRWVWLMLLATLLGAGSGLYDKFLLQEAKLSPLQVQAWFSIYLIPVLFPLFLFWWLYDRKKVPFQWRWSIPLITLFLLIADLFYFYGLADQSALVSVVSTIRRTSIIIPFFYGISQLKEEFWRSKLTCIIAILLGVYFISQS